MGIEKRFVLKVEFSENFPDASEKFGYDEIVMSAKDLFVSDSDSLFDKIIKLRAEWLRTNLVILYKDDADRAWGRVKAMDSVTAPGIGFYTGFFHGRLKKGFNDPLIVISFRNRLNSIPSGYDSAFEMVVVHGVSDHNALFGSEDDQRLSAYMRNKRQINSIALGYDGNTSTSFKDENRE